MNIILSVIEMSKEDKKYILIGVGIGIGIVAAAKARALQIAAVKGTKLLLASSA